MRLRRSPWRIVAVVVVIAAIAACGPGRWTWIGQPVIAGGIQIQVNEAHVQGHRLWVRTTFVNQTQVPLVVNRDAVVLVLPNGHVLARRAGPTSLHFPFIIPPGAVRLVNVEFESDGFHWGDFPTAQVNWSNAISVNGQPIALPPSTLVGAR